MHDRLRIEANVVRLRIDALLRTYPELAGDAELLASAVEGETDFERVIERIVDAAEDKKVMGKALGERIEALTERKSGFARGEEALRALAMELMNAAGQRMVRLPIATVSIASGKNKVVIDDINELTQGFYETKRVPRTADISAALAVEGTTVPGARLERAPDHLTIRVK